MLDSQEPLSFEYKTLTDDDLAPLKKPKLVLSITGGGVKGVIVSEFLKHLEQEIGEPIGDYFDLFVGTSVGSILCGAYTHGNFNAKKVADDIMNENNLQRIMKKGLFDKMFGVLNIFPKYSGDEKKELIEYYINSHMNATHKNVVYIAYDVKNNKPKLFKSWEDINIFASQAIDASSAAPGYYPEVEINGVQYIDGGVTANYPSDCAYADALSLWGEDADIRVLSLGTGKGDYNTNSKKWWGLIPWITKGQLLSLLFDANEQIVDYKVKTYTKALKHKYLYINGEINNLSMDDTSSNNILYLKNKGREWFFNNKKEIMNFLS